jgi:hypothetical protein
MVHPLLFAGLQLRRAPVRRFYEVDKNALFLLYYAYYIVLNALQIGMERYKIIRTWQTNK